MRKYKIFLLAIFISVSVSAKEYNASFFGIKSDGITNNTSSIQKAINFIKGQGGGTLVFYVGRYLTGSVYLKSNVNIRLEEGAVIVGASSPFAYNFHSDNKGLIIAEGMSNIKIYGKGVIEGSSIIEKNMSDLMEKGYLKNNIKPALIVFSNCKNISVENLHLWYNPFESLKIINSKSINLKGIEIDGKNLSGSDGILLEGCRWIFIKDLFVKVKNEPIEEKDNQYIKVQNSITETGEPLANNLE